MAFCGQCGFLLPSEATTCPRCSSTVPSSWESVDPRAHAPTIISTPDKTQPTENSYHSKPELVQEPNQFAGYNSETQTVEQGKNIPIPPTIQGGTLPGYYAQAPFPPPDYTSQTSTNFSQTQGSPYPSYAFPSGPSYPPSPVPPHKTKIWAILSVILLIFLVGTTTALLVVGPSRLLQMVRGGTLAPQIPPIPPTSQAPTPAPTLATPTAQSSPRPEHQAQSVIDHYYTAINSKDYQTAYNLWLNYPDTYQNFANGFANTSYDNYTFGNIAQQSDGTVQVDISVITTSTSSQQTTYQGYYIVAQQSDGTWKIISAKIHQA